MGMIRVADNEKESTWKLFFGLLKQYFTDGLECRKDHSRPITKRQKSHRRKITKRRAVILHQALPRERH